jgi:hypothetical protein
MLQSDCCHISEEAVRRVAGVAVIGQIGPAQREGSVGEIVEVGDPAVGLVDKVVGRRLVQADSGAGGEELQILELERRLERRERRQRRRREERRDDAVLGEGVDVLVADRREIEAGERQGHIGRLLAIVEADEVARRERLRRLELPCQFEVGPGRAVGLDDAFREQIRDAAVLRHERREEMIEAAILADDHDDVLDWRCRLRLLRRRVRERPARRDRAERERHQR